MKHLKIFESFQVNETAEFTDHPKYDEITGEFEELRSDLMDKHDMSQFEAAPIVAKTLAKKYNVQAKDILADYGYNEDGTQMDESLVNEAKDEANISFKKVKKKIVPVTEGEASAEDKDYEDRLEKLFKKLVPGSGAAETEEGEMVRAIMRVFYRYFNDGDFFFRGYGKETALPSVNWLKRESPLKKEMKTILSDAQKNAPSVKSNRYGSYVDQYSEDKDGYLKGIRKAVKAIVEYVESKKGKYTPNEAHDSR